MYDCVPSKTFIASSGARASLQSFPELGIQVDSAPRVDLPSVHARVRDLALAQSADIRARLQREGVRILTGTARFRDSKPGLATHKIGVTYPETGEEEILDADVVLVATGATPRVLPGAVPDGERILDWRQRYSLPELPEHLAVVGSGVTGAEFASAYTEMGVKVTVVSSRDRVLPHEDADAAAVLEEVFSRRGTTVVKQARAERVNAPPTGWSCTTDCD